jgi:hypothetical protein
MRGVPVLRRRRVPPNTEHQRRVVWVEKRRYCGFVLLQQLWACVFDDEVEDQGYEKSYVSVRSGVSEHFRFIVKFFYIIQHYNTLEIETYILKIEGRIQEHVERLYKLYVKQSCRQARYNLENKIRL